MHYNAYISIPRKEIKWYGDTSVLLVFRVKLQVIFIIIYLFR